MTETAWYKGTPVAEIINEQVAKALTPLATVRGPQRRKASKESLVERPDLPKRGEPDYRSLRGRIWRAIEELEGSTSRNVFKELLESDPKLCVRILTQTEPKEVAVNSTNTNRSVSVRIIQAQAPSEWQAPQIVGPIVEQDIT